MIADDVGISGDQHRALLRLFDWARTGRGRVTQVQRPVLQLQVPGHEVKCGMFFGAAIISQGIQYYQQNLHNQGLHGVLGICLTLFRSLWAAVRHSNRQMTATAMKICLDDQPPQEENFLLFFVTTLDRLFFGLRPFWGNEQGPLRYTAVRTQAPYLLRVLPMLARGRRCRRGTPENGYFSGNVREIRLFLDSPVALDGELYMPDSMQEPTVSVRRQCDLFTCRIMPAPIEPVRAIQQHASRDVSPAVSLLMQELFSRYGTAVQGIVFYGSCLHADGDRTAFLTCMSWLTDTYPPTATSCWPRSTSCCRPMFFIWNPFLGISEYAPNTPSCPWLIYAKEHRDTGSTPISWARFCQPTVVIYARDDKVATEIHTALAQAVITFISRVLPLLPRQWTIRDPVAGRAPNDVPGRVPSGTVRTGRHVYSMVSGIF